MARFWIPLEFVSRIRGMTAVLLLIASFSCFTTPAHSATGQTAIPFTLHGPVGTLFLVTGTPRVPVDVGGVTRYANYVSGDGTGSLNFVYQMQPGDVDLDGVTFGTTLDLNGGMITDQHYNLLTNLTVPTVNTSNVKVNYPSLGMDFVADADGRYTLNGTAYNDLPSFLTATGGTFTRNSVGTYYDSSGVLQTATANTPRFDHDPVTNQPKGILIEEARTNYVINAQFQGGATGVPPLNIAISNGGAGITATVTNAGVLNGEKYIEVTFSGTSVAVGQIYPAISFANNVVASQGQTWTGSIRIMSDTGTSSVNPYLELAELSSANSYLGSTNISITSLGHKVATRTFSNPSTAKTRWFFIFSLAPGQSVNRTFRFSIPQLEQGAFPTSYIPTTTAAVTRAQDRLLMPVGSWYDPAKGSLFANFNTTDTSTNYRQLLSIGASTGTSERVSLAYQNHLLRGEVGASNTLSVTQFFTSTPLTPTVSVKAGISYANRTNILSMSSNGSIVSGNGSGTGVFVAPNPNVFDIGDRSGNSARFNGYYSKIKYYPRAIPNTQLQLMTQ